MNQERLTTKTPRRDDLIKSNFFLRRFWPVLPLILIVIAVFGLAFGKKYKDGGPKDKFVNRSTISSPEEKSNGIDFDPDHPPYFIQADFVELDKVFMISKFRSGTGHDFSVNSGETCRSMKHYFSSMDPAQPNYKSKENPGDKSVYPIPTVEKDVKIFSPVDGTLKFVDFDQIAFNRELSVTPDAYPEINIRLQHVQPIPGIKEGKVKAGEPIGLVLANQSFDLAIEAGLSGKNKTGYISYFSAIPDSILKKYQARGIQSRDDLIITKEYRDAHPFSCHGKEEFDENYAFDDPVNNLVYLSGYNEISKKVDKQSSADSQDAKKTSQSSETSENQTAASIAPTSQQSTSSTKLEPGSIETPYINESDVSSINEAFSLADNNPYWGFRHPGIDFMTATDLVPVQAAVGGTVENLSVEKNDGQMGWHAGFCINPGGERNRFCA